MAVIAPERAALHFERRAMGSALRLMLSGAAPEAGERAWHAVETEFEAAEQALSRFRETSDLTRTNRLAVGGAVAGGGTVAGGEATACVDRRLVRALVAADRAQRITRGRFDPRILGDLERLGYRGVDQGAVSGSVPGGAGGSMAPERPAPERAASAGCAPGRWLRVDSRESCVSLGAPVDLGGIGKGLTLRWAWRLVRPLLADGAGAMLEAGGDLVADGPSPDGGPWTIGVEDPRGGHSADDPVTRGLLAVVTLERGAIATSSVVVNRWRLPDGRSVHHLIDPSTGEPGGSGLIAVTVAGPDPAWTEVWSKALFLGGAQAIGTEARARGLTAWWVRDDGTLEMTPGARQRTVWTAADA